MPKRTIYNPILSGSPGTPWDASLRDPSAKGTAETTMSGDVMSAMVLIVEDEVPIVQSLQCFLEDNGFDTCCAFNGQEGLEVVHDRQPDVVIVDLHMPVMDGYEFIERTRTSEPNLPIVVLSAEGMIDNAMAAIRAGG
jgi:CheY-like chemotaxis protein